MSEVTVERLERGLAICGASLRRKLLSFFFALAVTVGISASAFGQFVTLGAQGCSGTGCAGGGGGGCSQATTLVARMDGSQNTTAVTNLICGLVTDGVWAKMDVFYVFAINSTANANLYWVSTSFSATNSGATFTANQGYKGNGTTAVITTGFTPSTAGGNFTQNSASLGACNLLTSSIGGNQVYIGSSTGSILAVIGINGTMFYDINDGVFPTFAQSTIQGLWSVSRTGNTTMGLCQNGVSVATSSAAASVNINQAIDILALNNIGTPANFSDPQVPVAWIGGALTGTDESNLASRIHTYLVAVGAPSGC